MKNAFAEVMVIDQRGDGHHLEMIVIDPVFEEKNRLARSRHIFSELGEYVNSIHALTVKGFTPEEWKKGKDEFEPTEYVHIQR